MLWSEMIKTMTLKENQMCVVYIVIFHSLGARLHHIQLSVLFGTVEHPSCGVWLQTPHKYPACLYKDLC